MGFLKKLFGGIEKKEKEAKKRKKEYVYKSVDICIVKNKNYTLNLNQYFSDADNDDLIYDWKNYGDKKITVVFDDNLATIIPDKDFVGERYSRFTANDSKVGLEAKIVVNESGEPEEDDMPWISSGEVWNAQDIISYRSSAKQAIIDALIEYSPQRVHNMISELFTVEVTDTYYESFWEVFKELVSEGIIVEVGEDVDKEHKEMYGRQDVGHPDYYKKQAERLRNLKDDIVKLLKDKGVKMPASDIDAYLKYQNLDKIKKICEEMYQDGEISYAGNGRYFILSEDQEKPNKTSAPKSEAVDVKAELKKYKEMLDEGLIDKEDYEAKKDKLLGI